MVDPQDEARYLRLALDVALPFMQERLKLGHTLSHLLLDRLDFSQGAVISTLPEEVGVEAASKDLLFGGKMSSSRPLVRGLHLFPDGSRVPLDRYRIYPDGRKVLLNQPWIAIQSMISDFLGRYPDGVCIFEDHIHSSSHERPKALGHLASFGNESYTIVTASWAESLDGMSNLIRQNFGSWLEVGVLTFLPEEELPPYRGSFTADQLERIVDPGGGCDDRGL